MVHLQEPRRRRGVGVGIALELRIEIGVGVDLDNVNRAAQHRERFHRRHRDCVISSGDERGESLLQDLLDAGPVLAGARFPVGAGPQIAEIGDAPREIDTRLGSGVIAAAVVGSADAVGGIGRSAEERGLGVVGDPEKDPGRARVGLLGEQTGEGNGLVHGQSAMERWQTPERMV